jgi:hypothetical protein
VGRKEAEMTEVTRVCQCPECSVPFFIKFDPQQRLGETLVRVGCPRCQGFIRTHVPADFHVVATEGRPSAPATGKSLSA